MKILFGNKGSLKAMVPGRRIELLKQVPQTCVIPFNYPGLTHRNDCLPDMIVLHILLVFSLGNMVELIICHKIGNTTEILIKL